MPGNEMGNDQNVITGLAAAPVSWISNRDQNGEVVLGVRLELARNFFSYPFPVASTPEQKIELREKIQNELEAGLLGPGFFYRGDCLSHTWSRILEERWLLDREGGDQRKDIDLWLGSDRTLAMVVNQEEHLRVRAYGRGFDIFTPLRLAQKAAALVERPFKFAFRPNLGYLTSRPDRVGSGVELSLIMHLPGLCFTRQLEPVMAACRELHVEVAGRFGQELAAAGHFFQFTWRAGGCCDPWPAILSADSMVRLLVRSEKNARVKLFQQQTEWLYDYVGRAYGLLRYGRRLRENEMVGLLSALRLGCYLGLFSRLKLTDLSDLPVKLQHGHLIVADGEQGGRNDRTTAWRRSHYFRVLLANKEPISVNRSRKH